MVATKKRQPEPEQLKPEIEQMESELQKLEEARRLRKGEIEALETEQRGYVVAARVHKDPDAQSNIERIAGEIAKRNMDDLFDHDAIAEISASLETKRVLLRREQWKDLCGPLQQMLESRATGELEREALDLAQKLKAKLAEINDSDAEIANQFRSIHPLLYSLANEVDAVGRRRPDIISRNLEPEVENAFGADYRNSIGYDPQRPAVHIFNRLLKKLEEVMQGGPEALGEKLGEEQTAALRRAVEKAKDAQKW